MTRIFQIAGLIFRSIVLVILFIPVAIFLEVMARIGETLDEVFSDLTKTWWRAAGSFKVLTIDELYNDYKKLKKQ